MEFCFNWRIICFATLVAFVRWGTMRCLLRNKQSCRFAHPLPCHFFVTEPLRHKLGAKHRCGLEHKRWHRCLLLFQAMACYDNGSLDKKAGLDFCHSSLVEWEMRSDARVASVPAQSGVLDPIEPLRARRAAAKLILKQQALFSASSAASRLAPFRRAPSFHVVWRSQPTHIIFSHVAGTWREINTLHGRLDIARAPLCFHLLVSL